MKRLHSFGASSGVARMADSKLDLSFPWSFILPVLISLYPRVVVATGFLEAKASRALGLSAVQKQPTGCNGFMGYRLLNLA